MNEKAELKERLQYALDVREKKAVDLATALKIPKSSISHYLAGTREIKDSRRLGAIAEYLQVDEAWLMGYDVPMERKKPTKDDGLTDNQKKLIEFARAVPDDKVEIILRVMKSILEGD